MKCRRGIVLPSRVSFTGRDVAVNVRLRAVAVGFLRGEFAGLVFDVEPALPTRRRLLVE